MPIADAVWCGSGVKDLRTDQTARGYRKRLALYRDIDRDDIA